jgi:hypothetical protein
VHAHHRLAGAEDVVDRPAVGVGDAHEVGRREREYDRIDVAGRHAGVLQRADGGELRLLDVRVVGVVGLELALPGAEHRDGVVLAHWLAPGASKTMTTLPCCA